MLNSIKLILISLFLLSISAKSFSQDYLLIESFIAESNILDRKFLSIDIGGYKSHRNANNAVYFKARVVGISEPSTSYTEDASGIYIGAGLSAHTFIAPYIEAGIDIIDIFDIIIEENLDTNRECEKTNTCEHIHRDFYIKAGFRTIIAKQFLAGVFYERIAITNDDTIGSPYHNVAGISLGYLF